MNQTAECGSGYVSYQTPLNCCPNMDLVECPQVPCKMHPNGRPTAPVIGLIHMVDIDYGTQAYR